MLLEVGERKPLDKEVVLTSPCAKWVSIRVFLASS